MDLLTCLGVVTNVPIFSEWLPVDNSDTCEKINDYRQIIEIVKKVPFPFDDRQIIIGGYGFAIPERKAILILLQNYDKDMEDLWEIDDKWTSEK